MFKEGVENMCFFFWGGGDNYSNNTAYEVEIIYFTPFLSHTNPDMFSFGKNEKNGILVFILYFLKGTVHDRF